MSTRWQPQPRLKSGRPAFLSMRQRVSTDAFCRLARRKSWAEEAQTVA
nr:MAG TPA: hypothetical protein [Caudoviricetes sp.]